MPRFIVKKLVRDGVPSAITSSGGIVRVRNVINYEEVVTLLKEKIIEEANDLSNSGESKLLSYIIDLYDVLEMLIKVGGFSEKEIEKARNIKSEKYGTFENFTVLEEADIKDPYWIEYYRSRPNKYTEIKEKK
jgi:predicted house-cleaning noncanonical NTP pyrophosphatase (MazG superfamily)